MKNQSSDVVMSVFSSGIVVIRQVTYVIIRAELCGHVSLFIRGCGNTASDRFDNTSGRRV